MLAFGMSHDQVSNLLKIKFAIDLKNPVLKFDVIQITLVSPNLFREGFIDFHYEKRETLIAIVYLLFGFASSAPLGVAAQAALVAGAPRNRPSVLRSSSISGQWMP